VNCPIRWLTGFIHFVVVEDPGKGIGRSEQVANGKLCLGEAKSNGDLSGKHRTALKTAERYRI